MTMHLNINSLETLSIKKDAHYNLERFSDSSRARPDVTLYVDLKCEKTKTKLDKTTRQVGCVIVHCVAGSRRLRIEASLRVRTIR